MSYYIFKEALSPEQIGKHYPQSSKMSGGYPYNDQRSVWQIRNKWLDFTPLLDSFVLNGQSKKTDIVSSVALNNKYNILIKRELVKIWEHFNTCDHQVFPATVIYRKKKLDYSVLHFYDFHNHFIDFSKTNFFHRGSGRKKIKDLTINSHEDFIKHTKNPQNEPNPDYSIMARNICPSNLVLKEDKIDLDFFLLLENQSEITYIISERFKEALLQENVTGFDFINVNEYQFEFKN